VDERADTWQNDALERTRRDQRLCTRNGPLCRRTDIRRGNLRVVNRGTPERFIGGCGKRADSTGGRGSVAGASVCGCNAVELHLQLWVDGIPVLFETLQERTDNMFRLFGVARPTGVLCYTFRDSVQSAVSNADTYDMLLPTTPATLLEIAGTFGTIASGPGSITVVTGELFPQGGIPYTHLAS